MASSNEPVIVTPASMDASIAKLIISKSLSGAKLNSSLIILEETATIALDEALLLERPDAIGNVDSVFISKPKSSSLIPYLSKTFLTHKSIKSVLAPTSLKHLIVESIDFARHFILRPIPKADPKPVAIALIIVAEPGHLTFLIIISSHHKGFQLY